MSSTRIYNPADNTSLSYATVAQLATKVNTSLLTSSNATSQPGYVPQYDGSGTLNVRGTNMNGTLTLTGSTPFAQFPNVVANQDKLLGTNITTSALEMRNTTITGTANTIVKSGTAGLITAGSGGFTTTGTTNTTKLIVGNIGQSKAVILYDASPAQPTFTDYYGWAVEGGVLRHNVDVAGTQHLFSRGVTSSAAFTSLFTIKGNGIITTHNNSTSAVRNTLDDASGNMTAAGTITATGTITGGNVSTAGAVTATGTVTGGTVTAGSGGYNARIANWSVGTSPGNYQLGTASGTGASPTISGSDCGGVIVITTGTSPSGTNMIKLYLTQVRPYAIFTTLTPCTAFTASQMATTWVVSDSTSITLFNSSPVASTTYTWNYTSVGGN